MARPNRTPADEAGWAAAEQVIKDLYAAQGIPPALIPSRPQLMHDLRNSNPKWGSMADLAQWGARARADMARVRGRAGRQNLLVRPWDGLAQPHDVPVEEPIPPWVVGDNIQAWIKAQADMRAAQIAAQGQGNVAQWGALGQNPALWQQMQAAQMGPMADYFWNKFPQHFTDLGNIIGEQLNLNADRINKTNLAYLEDERKRDALRDTLAALESIYGGFSGALESGFGSLGEGLGQWGKGFSPLGGASGAFGAGGGGGFRILPNGSVVTAQDFSGAIPEAGRVGGGQVSLGPIAGVNAAAANELGQMARGAGRQAAGRIRGQFTAKAAREGDAASAALMGAGARANLGQLGNALLVAGGTNKNILSDAKAKATVMAAQNKARAARGKQMSGLVGKLGGLLPQIG